MSDPSRFMGGEIVCDSFHFMGGEIVNEPSRFMGVVGGFSYFVDGELLSQAQGFVGDFSEFV